MRDEDRLLLLFAYLGPLAFVSLAAGRSEFVRWHARQGLVLWLTGVVVFALLYPFQRLFYWIWRFLGDLFFSAEILILVGFVLVAILCMVRAMEGERFRIPFFGEFVDKF